MPSGTINGVAGSWYQRYVTSSSNTTSNILFGKMYGPQFEASDFKYQVGDIVGMIDTYDDSENKHVPYAEYKVVKLDLYDGNYHLVNTINPKDTLVLKKNMEIRKEYVLVCASPKLPEWF